MSDNPYAQPESSIQTQNRPIDQYSGFITKAIIMTTFALVPYIAALFICPQFEEIFENFGTNSTLPTLTRLILNNYKWLPLLWGFALIPCILLLAKGGFSPKTRHIFFKIITINLIFSILFIVVAVIAMYLPVFHVSTVV